MFIILNNSVNRVFIRCFGEDFYKVHHQFIKPKGFKGL